jgi:hypothetical protein
VICTSIPLCEVSEGDRSMAKARGNRAIRVSASATQVPRGVRTVRITRPLRSKEWRRRKLCGRSLSDLSHRLPGHFASGSRSMTQ